MCSTFPLLRVQIWRTACSLSAARELARKNEDFSENLSPTSSNSFATRGPKVHYCQTQSCTLLHTRFCYYNDTQDRVRTRAHTCMVKLRVQMQGRPSRTGGQVEQTSCARPHLRTEAAKGGPVCLQLQIMR